MSAVVLVVLAYLAGSVPTGVIAGVLWRDVDVREAGSGNIGATNVARLLGWRLGTLVLVGDILKGLVPVLLSPLVLDTPWYAGLVALAAFTGHCASIFLAFRGGKGIATATGAMLALTPAAVLLCMLVWGGIFAWRKTSSIAGLSAAVLLPFLVGWLNPEMLWVSLSLTLAIVVRHIPNIKRLLSGTEAPTR